MSDQTPKCIVCERSNEEIPLLSLNYQESTFWICPSHFPILIHQPNKLVGKLPGAEKLTPQEH